MSWIPFLGLTPLACLVLYWTVVHPNAWRFERNTPERKQLLLMLENLAEEPGEWEKVDWKLYRHKASSVSFVWDWSSATMTPGDIRFRKDTRGFRACARVRKGVEEHEKHRADIAALQGMNEAYRRWMN